MREGRRRHGERGQILPLVAFALVVMLGLLSMVADLGYWRYQQRLEQSAADSAAVAGAIRLNYTLNSASNATQVAKDAAAQNGFTDDGGVGNLVVTVNIPPSTNTPPHAGATPYPSGTAIEVIIKQKQSRFFSGIFGAVIAKGSARAVAVASPDLTACLNQLTNSSSAGISIAGNKPLTTVGCGVLANGNISVPSYSGTTSVGYLAANNSGGVGFAGAVALPSPLNDPCPRIPGCAYIAGQTIPALNQQTATNGANTTSITVANGQSYTVVYNCCTGTTTFGPGLYYIYGGISGAVQADAATLVNVNGTFTASGLGSGHPFFSAPSTGPTAGVAYYQPPSNTNSITMNGGGNGTSQWNGLFYAPKASFTSNGGSITFASLVIGDITLHGGGSGQGLVIDPTLSGQTTILQSEFATHAVLSE